MKKFLPALALASIMAAPAMAQGFYVDGGYSFVSIDSDGGDIDIGAVSARAGYDFTEYFSLEGEAAIGTQDEEIGNIDVSLNYLVGAYLKAQYPLSDNFNVYGRLGVVNAEIEAEGFGVTASDSDTGAGFGVGGQFLFSENVYARGEYTRVDIEEVEGDVFSIAFGYKF